MQHSTWIVHVRDSQSDETHEGEEDHRPKGQTQHGKIPAGSRGGAARSTTNIQGIATIIS